MMSSCYTYQKSELSSEFCAQPTLTCGPSTNNAKYFK